MADPEELLDKTIMAIITALIQVILLATVFIPTAIDMISGMSESAQQYKALLEVVVTLAIISVIIGIVMTYIRRR